MQGSRLFVRSVVTGLGLFALLFLPSCVPWLRVNVVPADPPSFQVRGTITSFWQRKVARLSVYGAPTGAAAWERLLWQIRARDGSRTLPQVRYGEVPAGFVQVVPAAGVAPPLRADWTYTVLVGGASGSGHERFQHTGAAVTVESLQEMQSPSE
jgi:hypothetical protein